MPELETIGVPETVETPTVETPETRDASVETPGEDSPSTDTAPEKNDDYEGLRQSLRAVTSERSKLKRENEELRQRSEGKQPETQTEAPAHQVEAGYKDAKELHPRLAGLNYDPNDKGQSVEIADGVWVPERVAIALAKQEAVAEEFESSKTEKAQAAEQAKVLAEQEKIVKPIQDGIVEHCAKFGLPDEDTTILTQIAENMVASALLKAGHDLSDPFNLSEKFEDEAVQSIKDTMAIVTRLFGGLSAAQLRKNAESKQKQGAKPGSAPIGVNTPKNIHTMSEAELSRYTADLVQNTENRQR